MLVGSGQATIVPRGDLDLATAPALESTVRDIRRLGFDGLVVDLRRLAFMDVAGLRALLRINDATDVAVVPGPPHVQRVFELTATDDAFRWR